MITIFTIIATFETANVPAVQWQQWRMPTLERCEEVLSTTLFNIKTPTQTFIAPKTKQRVIEADLAEFMLKPGGKPRLQCIEITVRK